VSEQALELAPATRSLPAVLRSKLAGGQLELLVGKVTGAPDRAHVSAEIGGINTTVPKLGDYNPNVGEVVYLLADDQNLVALGTVTFAPPPTQQTLTVSGLITGGGLQVNGNANVTGTLTAAGGITASGGATITAGALQINGNGTITSNLTVSGQITGGGVRTTNNTIQATGTTVGFFGKAPITQPRADFTTDAALLSQRIWTALRDLGLIQNI
jgi:phage baseplate assembly protein gpV